VLTRAFFLQNPRKIPDPNLTKNPRPNTAGFETQHNPSLTARQRVNEIVVVLPQRVAIVNPTA